MIVRSAKEDSPSRRGKSQEIDHDRRLRSKVSEKTMRGGEDGLGTGTKQRAHLKKSAN